MANTPLDVLQDYSQKFIDAIHSSLERNDRLASGLLWQSVSAPVKVMGQKIVMTIEFDSQTKYWRWVNDGRKAGGKQPPPLEHTNFGGPSIRASVIIHPKVSVCWDRGVWIVVFPQYAL